MRRITGVSSNQRPKFCGTYPLTTTPAPLTLAQKMQSNKQENYMKTIRSLRNGLIVWGVALAMASTLTAQNVTQQRAKVIRIKGFARFSVGNNVWQPLKAGEILRAGTVIQTGVDKGSFVDLVVGDVDAPVASTAGGGPSITPVV